MELFFLLPLVIPAAIYGLFKGMDFLEKYSEKRLPIHQKSQYLEARSDGEKDMSEALYTDIRDKILYQLSKIVYDDQRSRENRKVWKERYNIYRGQSQYGMSLEDKIEWTAEMIWNYELMMKDVYNFDLSLGQENKKYLGAEDENEYEAYIQGGLTYLDKLDNKKLQNAEEFDRVKRRRAGLKEINRRWSTVNEELTRLRNQPINVDAKAAFDKELNS